MLPLPQLFEPNHTLVGCGHLLKADENKPTVFQYEIRTAGDLNYHLYRQPRHGGNARKRENKLNRPPHVWGKQKDDLYLNQAKHAVETKVQTTVGGSRRKEGISTERTWREALWKRRWAWTAANKRKKTKKKSSGRFEWSKPNFAAKRGTQSIQRKSWSSPPLSPFEMYTPRARTPAAKRNETKRNERKK